MKSGIGQSKYSIPQPFSPCFISLCSSLFYFNSIFKETVKSKNKATRSKRATEIGSLALSLVAFNWEIWI